MILEARIQGETGAEPARSAARREALPWRRAAALLALMLHGCGGGSVEPATQGSEAATYDGSPCGETWPDPECHTLVSGSVTRAYLLHVPTSFKAGSSALVVALHGSNGSGLRLSVVSGLSATADREGFAVAYPYALVSPGAGITEWNEFFNRSFGSAPPDDVGFIRRLIGAVQVSLAPDPRRIYIAGLSNGGFMAHRFAVQASDLVAAIGVVEGTVVSPGRMEDVPPPLGPVSVLALHGDQDPTVLYCGGLAVASQDQTFNYWAGPAANRCTSVDNPAPLCDAQGRITSVNDKEASDCAGNTAVKFYKLQGGVHLWYVVPMNVPGQPPFNPDLDAATGVTTNDILWNFFKAHPKS